MYSSQLDTIVSHCQSVWMLPWLCIHPFHRLDPKALHWHSCMLSAHVHLCMHEWQSVLYYNDCLVMPQITRDARGFKGAQGVHSTSPVPQANFSKMSSELQVVQVPIMSCSGFAMCPGDPKLLNVTQIHQGVQVCQVPKLYPL